MNDNYLVPAEVAAKLRFAKVDVVYRLIRSGALAAVNVGTGARPTWRIPAEALDRFLADRHAVPALAAGQRTRQKRPAKVTAYF